VLAVIFVVIALLLQAIVAPLLLVLMTALSFAASFGLSSLLWRHGLGFAGVESVIPIYIFIFLVALGVDYNIFLSARIREESRRVGLRDGTLRGVGVTGGVITAAGIVLAGTFLALTQIPEVSIAEVGTSVALGVLLGGSGSGMRPKNWPMASAAFRSCVVRPMMNGALRGPGMV